MVFAHTPLHVVYSGELGHVHWPLTHASLPEHALPQLPHAVASLVRSTQRPSQKV
jgi:hypothetical protein